jgi:hypothetical protein
MLHDEAPIYLAIVEAAANHPAEAERAVQECLESGMNPADLNGDEDLGPLLNAPQFAALRKKHLDGHGLDP